MGALQRLLAEARGAAGAGRRADMSIGIRAVEAMLACNAEVGVQSQVIHASPIVSNASIMRFFLFIPSVRMHTPSSPWPRRHIPRWTALAPDIQDVTRCVLCR